MKAKLKELEKAKLYAEVKLLKAELQKLQSERNPLAERILSVIGDLCSIAGIAF